MSFNFDWWKRAVLAVAEGTISTDDLLEAAGLRSCELSEDDFNRMLEQIEDDLEEERRAGEAGRSPR